MHKLSRVIPEPDVLLGLEVPRRRAMIASLTLCSISFIGRPGSAGALTFKRAENCSIQYPARLDVAWRPYDRSNDHASCLLPSGGASCPRPTTL